MLKEGHFDRRTFWGFAHLPVSVPKCKKRRPNRSLYFWDPVQILDRLMQVNESLGEKSQTLTDIVKSVRLTPNSPPFPGPVAANFKSAKNSGKVRKHTLLIEVSPSSNSFVSLNPSPLLLIMTSQRLWGADKAAQVASAWKVYL
jgi:hypothetical protein